MQRPTLIQNIAMAMLLTVLSLIAGFTLHKFVTWHTGVKLTITLVAAFYFGYWFYSSRIRAGKFTAAGIVYIILFSSCVMLESINSQLILIVGLLWAIRTLLFYSSSFAAVVDLGLCVFSLACAYWVFFTNGSMVFATWSFLLLQSLQAMIPNKTGIKQGQMIEQTNDRFNHAYQTAETALRTLAKKM